jgi:hypothetical protein
LEPGSQAKGIEPVPKSKGTARAKRSTAIVPAQSTTELEDVMWRFAQAISLVRVCHRSLETQPHIEVGDEEMVLSQAVEMLRAAYNQLDMAVVHLSQNSSS